MGTDILFLMLQSVQILIVLSYLILLVQSKWNYHSTFNYRLWLFISLQFTDERTDIILSGGAVFFRYSPQVKTTA